MAKLTEKSTEVFEYVKNAGGKVSIPELCEALNRAPRSVGANVTDLTKKGLAERQKEKDGEGEVTYTVACSKCFRMKTKKKFDHPEITYEHE